MVLLLGVRLAGVSQLSLAYIAGFAAAFYAANYLAIRIVTATRFRPWYAHLNLILGAAMISAVLYACPAGDVLYARAIALRPRCTSGAATRGARRDQCGGFRVCGIAGPGSWGWRRSFRPWRCSSARVDPMLAGVVARLHETRAVPRAWRW
jgi:hypothetical protein